MQCNRGDEFLIRTEDDELCWIDLPIDRNHASYKKGGGLVRSLPWFSVLASGRCSQIVYCHVRGTVTSAQRYGTPRLCDRSVYGSAFF